jgi:hypothetical protein
MGRLQNNPSIGWVHPKFTHAHPLAWGNKNCILETWSESKNYMSNATHTPPPNYYSKTNVTVIFQNPKKKNLNKYHVYTPTKIIKK